MALIPTTVKYNPLPGFREVSIGFISGIKANLKCQAVKYDVKGCLYPLLMQHDPTEVAEIERYRCSSTNEMAIFYSRVSLYFA